MTTAIEIARQLYAQKGCADKFDDDLRDHRETGKVHQTTNEFVMAKAVLLPDGRLVWFIKIAVGSMKDLAKHLPFWLPWIAFHRIRDEKPRLRVYRMPLPGQKRGGAIVPLLPNL